MRPETLLRLFQVSDSTFPTGFGEDAYTFAPLVDVRSMRHERQRVRLYIS